MKVTVLEHHPNDSRLIIKEDGICQTLNRRMGTGGGNVPLVMVEDESIQFLSADESGKHDVHRGCGGGCLVIGTNPGFQNGVVIKDMSTVVRRLTPLECERLQGFPDGWTEIGEWQNSKGKKQTSADSKRYQALGNSIALPQWFWLVNRLKPYLPEGATMASLFDGIGGFPLVWEKTYGEGTAIWASEIEEFPIAVTKVHFGEANNE